MKLNNKKQAKEKTIKILSKSLKILLYLLILILLIFICINEMKVIKTFNYEAFIIISESMEPEIKVGNIVIIKKVSEENIKAEDIITFEKNNQYITHRVKEINEQDGMKTYTTRGDNNQVKDEDVVSYSEIKGIKIAQIPYIGLLILKVSKRKNIIIILIVVFLLYNRAIKKDHKNKERAKKKRVEDEKVFKD